MQFKQVDDLDESDDEMDDEDANEDSDDNVCEDEEDEYNKIIEENIKEERMFL